MIKSNFFNDEIGVVLILEDEFLVKRVYNCKDSLYVVEIFVS